MKSSSHSVCSFEFSNSSLFGCRLSLSTPPPFNPPLCKGGACSASPRLTMGDWVGIFVPPYLRGDLRGVHHSQGDALTRSPRATMKRPMRGSHDESACQFVVGCTHSNVKPTERNALSVATRLVGLWKFRLQQKEAGGPFGPPAKFSMRRSPATGPGFSPAS
jgi:hypothetical protein